MYLPNVYSTHNLPTLYDFLRQNRLGVFTTSIPYEDQCQIQSTHIPFVLDLPADYDGDLPLTDPSLDSNHRRTSGEPLGTLRCHIARANMQSKALVAAAKAASGLTADDRAPDGPVTLPDEVLILFTGPISHYVTPHWYAGTKPTTGKVAPTWNYEAVQAYGRVTVYASTSSEEAGEFLHQTLEDLSHQEETSAGFDGLEGRTKEWKIADAPEKYIHLLKKGTMGISVEITRLEGKFKMSQEQRGKDRQGVVDGFRSIGGNDMADSVERWAKKD